MNVIIIGKNGQVAWELMQTCPKNINAIAFGRNDIDISDVKTIENVILKHKPVAIINAAAYTAVDKAESEPEEAFKINAELVEQLAKLSNEYDVRLLQVSTDFVFDGKKNTPYAVSDETLPISVYGKSKLCGEQAVIAFNPQNSAIIRTSWVYSSHGNNFVKTMLRLMKEKEFLNVVADQVGCPTSARGLANYLWELVEQKKLDSIYHYSDLGTASWYDFAVAIQELAFEKGILDRKISIHPIPTSAYPTPASRPAFSLLKQDSLSKQHWRAVLESEIDQFS